MKRELLEGLGLEKDAIDKIMAANGEDIQREKQAAQNAKADVAQLREQLADRTKDLEDLRKKSGGADEVRAQLDELRQKYDADTKLYQDKLAERDYLDAMSRAISGASIKFSSKGAERDFRAALKEKALELKDGALNGFDEFVKAHREADPGAFAPDKQPPRFVRLAGGEGDGLPKSVGAQLAEQLGKSTAAANKAATDVINIYSK